jgi:hypothetical protein
MMEKRKPFIITPEMQERMRQDTRRKIAEGKMRPTPQLYAEGREEIPLTPEELAELEEYRARARAKWDARMKEQKR